MSGPVSSSDASVSPSADEPVVCDVELIEGRQAEVGGFAVNRLLPRRPRRTVGAWCFADHMGPGEVTAGRGLNIGPHPHIGLQTVTWLFEGAILHRDSLGSEQVIRPGQLNLMTAGQGVAHSEETDGVHTGRLHGIQLWVAQPEETRHGEAAFEHRAELPRVDLDNGVATVLIGQLLGAASPARRDTDHVGAEIVLHPGFTEIPLDPACEYGVITIEGSVRVLGRPLGLSQHAYLGVGRDEVVLEVTEPATVLLIGGTPFPEPLLMWWNYVARTREEVVDAHRDWNAHDTRFGTVTSPFEWLTTGDPPWT